MRRRRIWTLKKVYIYIIQCSAIPIFWNMQQKFRLNLITPFEVTNSHSFEVSSSQYEVEQGYKSDDSGEIDDNNTGDYYTYIRNKNSAWLNKLGLIEDEISVRVSTISSETSLLDTSNASINIENSLLDTSNASINIDSSEVQATPYQVCYQLTRVLFFTTNVHVPQPRHQHQCSLPTEWILNTRNARSL